MNNTNKNTLSRVYDFYWKLTSVIWGFIFLDFKGVAFFTLGGATGQTFALGLLVILSILAFATVVFTKDRLISNDLIILGVIVPIGYVFWQIDWLTSSIQAMFVFGLVGYYWVMNITSVVFIIFNKVLAKFS